MSNKKLFALVVLNVLLIFLSTPAKTVTFPGSERTIQATIEKQLNEGDTLLLKNGSYYEHLVLKDNISLIGESVSGTKIHGKGKGVVISAGDRTLIKNLTICNGATGVRCNNTSATIEGCVLRDNKGTGIHSLITVPNIRNCIIYRNDWTGIYCESGRSIKTTIEHNIISENGYSGIMLSGTSEILIVNNIFFGNKQFAVWASVEARKSRIVHNDFFANRNNANYFASLDNSNIGDDPELDVVIDIYSLFSAPTTFKDKGRDNEGIGLIPDSRMHQKTTDLDGDNVLNDEDQCVSIAEDLDGFEDDDGCPDFDNDKDGIYDSQDQCPDDPEDFDSFKDDDGCSDPDNDEDGVPDTTDICPGNKEVMNGYKDEDGCPDEVPAPESETK
ncbi:MAG: right-handed parallel beta-helix repeat-containing protein [Chitinispirillaceae bacterium]|nr:right-handed parallel beta-helix repeat-containing protein [Chitinispirillaceae bacterium]